MVKSLCRSSKQCRLVPPTILLKFAFGTFFFFFFFFHRLGPRFILRLTTRLRLCKVLFGGCFDDYQIIPVPELAANVDWTDKTQSLTLSFACNHSWVSSDKYLITIESTTV
jgi:hypothetical protein